MSSGDTRKFCRVHRGGKNPKICQNLLILAFFFLLKGVASGGRASDWEANAPLDAVTGYEQLIWAKLKELHILFPSKAKRDMANVTLHRHNWVALDSAVNSAKWDKITNDRSTHLQKLMPGESTIIIMDKRAW